MHQLLVWDVAWPHGDSGRSARLTVRLFGGPLPDGGNGTVLIMPLRTPARSSAKLRAGVRRGMIISGQSQMVLDLGRSICPGGLGTEPAAGAALTRSRSPCSLTDIYVP